jgi:hypothetical protein
MRPFRVFVGEYALMFRTFICCTALVLGLSLNAVAAPACDDDGCQAATPSKPLDIMKFMKEQAANTRAATAKPRPTKAQPVAHVQRPAHRAVAARRKPADMPVEAAASYATQEPRVQIVDSDELNDIDRAAPEIAAAAPAETTGAAIAAEPNVQLVDNGEFNDIDRKAGERMPQLTAMRIADAHASAQQSSVSWWQWIGSAFANIFVALATAVHQLLHL